MSNYCNNCPKFVSIPTCTEDLVIGTLTGYASTAVFVYLKNHTTGFIHRFSATTTMYGGLTIELPDNGNFSPTPKHDYELWVTLQTATNTDERLDITINSIDYECVSFTFENIFVGYNLVEYTSQTLKLK